MPCNTANSPTEASLAVEAPKPDSSNASSYEAEHVQNVYNQIAPHFAATRYAPWPRVNSFIQALPLHSIFIDIGCGNGKYLAVAQQSTNQPFAIGTDLCEPLVSFARNRNDISTDRYDVSVANGLHLPFRTGLCDAAINIAVIHHFCTRERRIAAIREMVRVLRYGGRGLIYVWAIERPNKITPKRGNHGAKMLNRRFEAQDMFVPWHMRRRKEGADNDKILGDWDEVHRRYYHVYREHELEEEVKEVENAKIVESYYDHQNWCIILEKVNEHG